MQEVKTTKMEKTDKKQEERVVDSSAETVWRNTENDNTDD